MGQLVQFEKELLSNPNNSQRLNIDIYLPNSRHVELSEAIRQSSGGGSSANSTPEPRSAGGNLGSASVEKSGQPFLLKMPKPRKRNQKQQNADNSLCEKEPAMSVCVADDCPPTGHGSLPCHMPTHPQDTDEPTSHVPFPKPTVSPPSNVNDSLSILPSASLPSTSTGVKDIIKKFEKSD